MSRGPTLRPTAAPQGTPWGGLPNYQAAVRRPLGGLSSGQTRPPAYGGKATYGMFGLGAGTITPAAIIGAMPGLDAEQKANAATIAEEFSKAGYSTQVVLAALVNSYRESYLRNSSVGDNGQSVGLFQIRDRDNGKMRAFTGDRRDPRYNCEWVLTNEKAGLAKVAAAPNVLEAVAAFTRYVERPANPDDKVQDRKQLAGTLLGPLAQLSSYEVPSLEGFSGLTSWVWDWRTHAVLATGIIALAGGAWYISSRLRRGARGGR